MPRRTIVYTQLPWDGGINTSVDAGVIPVNDLVQADNIIFSSNGARIKREGHDYFDAASAIPNVTSRSSSGTTRTLVFSGAVNTLGREALAIGESITVTSSASETDYTGTFTIDSITTTNETNDTITYTATTSVTEADTATSTLTVQASSSYIGLKDYWYLDASNVKQQRIVAVSDQPKLFYYDINGDRTEISKDATATALSTIEQVDFSVINNRLIMSFDGASTPKKYYPEDDADWKDLGGSPPNFSVSQVHLARLWTNDKDNPDRLNYSATGNPEQWNGEGDSAYLTIGEGDGDQDGIISIFRPFRGRLFVSKKSAIYEIQGNTPESFRISEFTNGLGAISHQAVVPVDLNDEMFVSTRGFHSIAATDKFGDFEGGFLSAKIQPSFNDFVNSRLKFTQGAYIPSINSVAFSVSDDGASKQSDIWLFNIEKNEWYRWPSINAQSLAGIQIDQKPVLMYGTDNSRVVTTQNGNYTDFGSTGISMTVKSGAIYPDNNPQTIKMFKRMYMYFKPRGDFSFTVKYKIDNKTEQSITYAQPTDDLDLLGSTFVLGSSILGNNEVLAPFSADITGIGRGITVTIESTGTNEQVEVYGFGIEYEPAGLNEETQ